MAISVAARTPAAVANGLSFTSSTTANDLGSSRERSNVRRNSLPGTLRRLIGAVIISAFGFTISHQI